MPKRNWEEEKFQGVDEGTGMYIKWIDDIQLEIGSQGHASVLSDANLIRVANAAVIDQRETTIYETLTTQATVNMEEFKLIDTIQKNRDRRIEKQEKEDTHANAIISIIQKRSGDGPCNIVNMHNKVTTNSPLQRVQLILQSFETEYKGTVFATRQEYNVQLDAIEVAHIKSDLPSRMQSIEDLRIECESLYSLDITNPHAVRGYTDEELIHCMLQRMSTTANDMTAIREKVSDGKKRGDTWAQIKRIIGDDIKDAVQSLDCKTSNKPTNIQEIARHVGETKNVAIVQGHVNKRHDNNSTNGTCYNWKDYGTCRRGNNCRFLHPKEAEQKQRDHRGYEDNKRNDRRQNHNRARSPEKNEDSRYDRSRKQDRSPIRNKDREWSRSRSSERMNSGKMDSKKGPSTPHRSDHN